MRCVKAWIHTMFFASLVVVYKVPKWILVHRTKMQVSRNTVPLSPLILHFNQVFLKLSPALNYNQIIPGYWPFVFQEQNDL